MEQLVADQFVPPDAAEIERALTATWERAAQETRRAGGAPVTRACMGTVVVLAAPDADIADVTSALAEWSGEYPARSIIVCLEETASRPSLEASFSAACRLPESGGRQMCCEVIRLVARGEAAAHVSATILGLLVSDLPVTVWCAGTTHGDLARLSPVLDTADHVVIDSGAFLSGYAALQWMHASGLAAHRARVVDLTWMRLLPWRRLLAELFDGPDARATLDRIEHVSLTGRPAVSAGALLLAGWLVSRLEWSVGVDVRARERSVRARAPGDARDRTIAFRQSLAAIAGHPVHDVALRLDGGAPAVYLVRSDPGGATLEASVTQEGACPVPRTLHAAPPRTGALLHAAVVRSSSDRAFREAVGVATALAAALGGTGDVSQET